MANNVTGHVPVKDFYSPQEVAALLGIGKNRVYELARCVGDPLPLRRMVGAKRGMFAHRAELVAWAMRNSELVASLR